MQVSRFERVYLLSWQASSFCRRRRQGQSLCLTYGCGITLSLGLRGHIGTGFKIIQCKTIIMYFHKDEILLSLLTYKGFINDGLSGRRSPAYSHIKQAGTEMLLLLPPDINQRNMSPHHLLSPRPSPLLFKWIGGEFWLAGWHAGRFRQGDGVTPELCELIYCFSIKMYHASSSLAMSCSFSHCSWARIPTWCRCFRALPVWNRISNTSKYFGCLTPKSSRRVYR